MSPQVEVGFGEAGKGSRGMALHALGRPQARAGGWGSGVLCGWRGSWPAAPRRGEANLNQWMVDSGAQPWRGRPRKHLGPDPRGCERGQLGKQGPRLGGDQAVYPGRKTQVPELSGKLNCKDYKGELLKKKNQPALLRYNLYPTFFIHLKCTI